MDASLVYITAGSREEAEAIAAALVEARLAASVNVVEGVQSVYHWKGKIERAEEAIVFAKTRQALVGQLIERVKAVHGYECPCIIALSIADGNPAYLEWLATETA